MAAKSSSTAGSTRRRPAKARSSSRGTSAGGSTARTGEATQNMAAVAYARVRQAAETAIDVPVGTALAFADRLGEVLQPWISRETAERELRSLRTQLRRDLNKVERRGGSTRRKVTQRTRRNRNRAERELNRRRRRVETLLRQNRRRAEQEVRRNRRRLETTVRQNRRRAEAAVVENRRRAEQQLKQVQTQFEERISTLV